MSNTIDKVFELGRKYEFDEIHAMMVVEISLMLFDATISIHRLGNAERKLLGYACLLHDIGHFINEQKHHLHSRYLVNHDKLLDCISPDNRRFISLIVYNHRKKIDSDTYNLPHKEKDMVLKLCAILRIADAMQSGDQNSIIRQIVLTDKELLIMSEGEISDIMHQRLGRKKELFVETFGMDVLLTSYCQSNIY